MGFRIGQVEGVEAPRVGMGFEIVVIGLPETPRAADDALPAQRGGPMRTRSHVQRYIETMRGIPRYVHESAVESVRDESIFEDPKRLEQEVRKLEQEMLAAAEALEFEKAAECRDRIRYLRENAIFAP